MSHNQNFHMEGLREDDAAVSMGGAYAPDAEGSAEADRGALRGLREDDAEVTLGVSAYDRLMGLREDDARTVLHGAYAPDAEGSAEADRGALRGLREDDASLRLGVSAYDEMSGLREDDASLRMGSTPVYGFSAEVGPAQQGMGQPGELVSNGRMGGMREDDAGIRLGVSAYDELSGLREDDASLRLRGLREDDAAIGLRGAYAPAAERSAEGDAAFTQQKALSGFTQLVLSGLREDDAALVLSRSMGRMSRSAIAPNADLFRLHRYSKQLMGIDERYEVGGLFDFLKPGWAAGPTADEYVGVLGQVVRQWEDELKPNLLSLPAMSQESIRAAMAAAKCSADDYEGMRDFLTQGHAGLQAYPGRWDRVKRLSAYTPTLRTMIAQQMASGPSTTPTQTQETVNRVQDNSVDQRIQDSGKPNVIMGTVLPLAGGAALLTGLVVLGAKLLK